MRLCWCASIMLPWLLVSSAFGEELVGAERAKIEILVGKQEAYLDQIDTARMDFTSLYRENRRSVVRVSGEAIWSGQSMRIDYSREVKRVAGRDESTSGILLADGDETTYFDLTNNRVRVAVGKEHFYGFEFLVHPRRSWFWYRWECPYREIITADESWDYGERNVSVGERDGFTTLTLDHPDHPGQATFRFNDRFGGLLDEMRNGSSENVRYYAVIEWMEDGDLVRPSAIRKYVKGDTADHLELEVKISNMKILDPKRLPKDLFTRESLAIPPSAKVESEQITVIDEVR